MKALLYAGCVMLMVAGCSHHLADEKRDEMTIFTSEQASEARFPHLPRTTVFWTPSESTVRYALPDIRKTLAEKSPATASKFAQYRCQVMGVIVDGRKVISFNFFSNDISAERWRTKPVIVFDGGDSTFQVEFDVQDRKCTSVTIPPGW